MAISSFADYGVLSIDLVEDRFAFFLMSDWEVDYVVSMRLPKQFIWLFVGPT